MWYAEGYKVETAAVFASGKRRTIKNFGWDLDCAVQSWRVNESKLFISLDTDFSFFCHELEYTLYKEHLRKFKVLKISLAGKIDAKF